MSEAFKTSFIIIFYTILYANLNAQQNRSSLENQRAEINKQLARTAKDLEKTSQSKKLEAEKLAVIKERAKSKSKLLSEISVELNSISDKIEFDTEKIAQNTEKLELIKLAYKKVLFLLYKERSALSIFDLMFSIESYKVNYKRQFYLKRLQKKYYALALNLKNEQEQLNLEIKQLKDKKSSNKQKLKQSKEQSGSLDNELERQEKQFSELSAKERKLKKELAANEESKRKLNNKIESIIKEQIAASKSSSRSYESSRRRRKTASNLIDKNASGSIRDNNAPTLSFAAQKGKLPKPIKGTIVSHFGKQQHPVYAQVFTHNNGIDIKAASAGSVKAVHEGYVVSVFAVPGNGNAVMLKHGDYYSTYSNLEQVNVKRGDNVKSAAQLGTVGKDSNTGNYLLHFEIWEGKNKENPEDWLR
jgi:septal ring factor EnvC (AmiA/AmiB activator)